MTFSIHSDILGIEQVKITCHLLVIVEPASRCNLRKALLCPNCGAGVDFSPDALEFSCKECGRALIITPEGKLVLSQPLTLYSDREKESKGPRKANKTLQPLSPPRMSPERLLRSSQLTYVRLTQEKQRAFGGLVLGVLLLIFGGVFLILAYARYLLIATDWMNLVGFGLGILFIPLGLYLIVWFALAIQTWNKNLQSFESETERPRGGR